VSTKIISAIVVSALFAALIVGLCTSPAEATIIHYNLDYDGLTVSGGEGVINPPLEAEEPYTAIFTNSRLLDKAVPSIPRWILPTASRQCYLQAIHCMARVRRSIV